MKKSKNRIFAEELLVPNAKMVDAYRLIMFASNTAQFVNLKSPEIPRFFSGFENQIGERSMALYRAKDSFEIIAKISKNEFNYDLIIKYNTPVKEEYSYFDESSKSWKNEIIEKDKYDIISFRKAVNLTEDYGYALEDRLSRASIGSHIAKDTICYSSNDYDKDGNFGYGVNLKTAYLSYKNLTFEDAVVITQSAADKLSSWKVEETYLTANIDNNIYLKHNNKPYCFPKVGDVLNDKLVAVSREKSVKGVANTNITSVRNILKTDYKVYSNGGKVVDISIYANDEHIKKLSQSSEDYHKEILELYLQEKKYWQSLYDELNKIIPTLAGHAINRNHNQKSYSEELARMWKMAKEWLSDSKWCDDDGHINNIKIKYVILKEHKLEEGAKLVGRYGDKGIVSKLLKIIPDEECLYYTDLKGNKQPIEMYRNQLGVFNRENLAQIYEQHANFVINNLSDVCSTIQDQVKRQDYFFKAISMLNPKYSQFILNEYKKMSQSDRDLFWRDVYDKKFAIHAGPFEDCVEWDAIVELKMLFPEIAVAYEVDKVEFHQVVGEEYALRLKHDSSNKTSVRSTGINTAINLPASYKSHKKNKEILVPDTSVRMGVMETLGLSVINNPKLLKKFYRLYSTNAEARATLIQHILTNTQAFTDFVDISGIEEPDINSEVLSYYFELLELRMEE